MDVVYILILAALAVAGAFLALFIWAVKNGQYDDTSGPPRRILFDDTLPPQKEINPYSKKV